MHFSLPLCRGITNCVKDFVVGEFLACPVFYFFKKKSVLGGLGNNNSPIKGWEEVKVNEIINDIPFFSCITQQADNFRVIFVSDDDGRITLFCVFMDDGLDFDNMRTCSVDNLEACLFKIFLVLGETPWALIRIVPDP